MKVEFIGEVIEKNDQEQKVSLKQLTGIEHYSGRAPDGDWWGSLNEVTNAESINKLFGVSTQPSSSPTTKFMIKNLNTILYGPPGTGKTYHTIRHSVQLIYGTADGTTAHKRFRDLIREDRIAFLTFHQSYAYEDFVEGIRPDSDAQGENVRFTCQDGIFKQMAIKAIYACLEPADHPSAPSFDELWDKLLADIKEHENYILKDTRYKLSISKRKTLNATSLTAPTARPLPINTSYVRDAYSKLKHRPKISGGDVKREIEVESLCHVIAPLIMKLKDIEEKQQGTLANATDESGARESNYEKMKHTVSDFLCKGEASGYRLKNPDDCNNFVLIIDEINRGNISKILGELITLLESDKRLGADNELIVKLPYSREFFAVPRNLYIIGTMNTADKSIALVDIALRRRFHFEELCPDFSLCPQLPQELRSVLERINTRIMQRKDRDHRIGHAYFMKVNSDETFEEIMRYKIIPLLSEYFYNDWEGLRYVLGEKGQGELIVPISTDTNTGRNRWQWYYDAGNTLSIASILKQNLGGTNNNGT